MPARRNDLRCLDCGARLIVMRFSERISYHCRTHGPLVLDADGNLRPDDAQPNAQRCGSR